MADEHTLSVEGILKAPAVQEAPAGWVTLTPAFFSDLTPDDDLTNFFNGGEPAWEVVTNPGLQRLQLTDSLLERTRRRIREGKAGIELLIGPTGEGKSTAIRQGAAIIAQETSQPVLWRQHRDGVLNESVLEVAYNHGPGTVLASDNAQLLLEELHNLIKDGKIPAASGLQLLLASRDTDWTRRSRELGFRINPVDSWKNAGPIVSTKHPFGRVSDVDARKIIQSWRALEPRQPDAIASLSDGEAAALLSEESASATPEHGTLLGGLLALRYTPEELRAHLADLLESLSQDTTQGEMTLADVVIVLAVVDVAGVDGIPSKVVSRFCHVAESRFRSQVANRLGREAVANYSDDVMRSRHPMVSAAILDVSMSDDSDFEVESAANRLLETIGELGGDGTLSEGYGEVFGVGRALYKSKLPGQLGPKARRLGLALASKACQVRPKTLVNHMSLSECLRSEDRATTAVASIWAPIADKLLDKDSWQDWKKNVRTALNEFAITASLAGDELEAAVLRIAALSLTEQHRSDQDNEEERISFTLRGLSIHLSRLYSDNKEPWLADVLAGIHGCILACFPHDATAITMTKESLKPTGRAPNRFVTPAIFTQDLDKAMTRMVALESDYLNIESWRSRMGFADLEAVLARVSAGADD